MAFNEVLARRVRAALVHIPRVQEKKMFGGLAFMVNGKMCISASKDRLMFRIDPAIHKDTVKRKGCRTVVMKGREYKGYVYVNEEGIRTEKDFDHWIGLALDYNQEAKASTSKKKK